MHGMVIDIEDRSSCAKENVELSFSPYGLQKRSSCVG